jgi:hypothetical protein
MLKMMMFVCAQYAEIKQTTTHKSQNESGGQVGYATGKPAPLSSIHPSKRACLIQSKATTSDAVHETSNSDTSDTDSQSQSAYSNTSSSCSSSQLIYNSTSSASKLVTQNSLSTHQASKVCKNLSAEGFTLPTPSQSGVWRSVIRAGEKNKKKIKAILRDGTSYCLHFDGTKISQQEYEVVILQNEERQINLGILKCQSGKAEDIYRELKSLIDEFDAWRHITMIICDTTAVNTGHRNGIVKKLKSEVVQKGYPEPQYIGCQHHILDLILKHVLDFFFETPSTKPSVNYPFIDTLLKDYEELQHNYKGEQEIDRSSNPGWRADFKFLYELCQSYRHYKVSFLICMQ